MYNAPRMRLVKEAAAELKAKDPKTRITAHALRKMLMDGEVPYITAGNRRLVNMDILERYLAGDLPSPAPGNMRVLGRAEKNCG